MFGALTSLDLLTKIAFSGSGMDQRRQPGGRVPTRAKGIWGRFSPSSSEKTKNPITQINKRGVEMNEIWKPLIYGTLDLSDKIEVSNLGKLRSLQSGRTLKCRLNKCGYYEVCISLGQRRKYKSLKVHRCVAFMFVNGYREGLVVDHIDGDKTNNNCLNLEWVTPAENTIRAKKNGLLPFCKKVICDQTGEEFLSMSDVYSWCGVTETMISRYFRHPDKHKSVGKHPITGEKLTWHLVEADLASTM